MEVQRTETTSAATPAARPSGRGHKPSDKRAPSLAADDPSHHGGLGHCPRPVRANRFERRLGFRRALGIIRLTLTLDGNQLFDVPMNMHPLLEHLLDRRMKARQQQRLLPTLRRNLRQHVRPGETMREQSVKELLEFRVSQSFCPPVIHAEKVAVFPPALQPLPKAGSLSRGRIRGRGQTG
jgi:hypothetical protein